MAGPQNGPCLMMTCDSAVIPAIVGTTAIMLPEDRAISRFLAVITARGHSWVRHCQPV